MKAALITIGILNLVFAFVTPHVSIANYATTSTRIMATYPRQGTPPDEFSDAERKLLKSIEQQSASSGFRLIAIFGIQGLALIASGIMLRNPIRVPQSEQSSRA